jgi:hypothetical protein
MTKYTPLVKSMQKDLKNKGFNLSLEQTYQKLLKANFINTEGEPTEWAIKNGYVGFEYTYPQGMQDNFLNTTLEKIDDSLEAINRNLDTLNETLDRMADNQEKELHEIATDCYENFGTIANSLEALTNAFKGVIDYSNAGNSINVNQ